MLGQQRLAEYLSHILEAIDRIYRYTKDMDESAFANNPLVQDAVIRNLEIIGEASHNIEKRYATFAASHPELPLSSAYQMRNAVAHGYFKVDLEIVWRTIQRELPSLHEQVKALLAGVRG
ncbi:Conserved hypothetical protein [gamma proteobacterium HdN1]|nr:Conserved hypothetical protein [gamma proteobacterium HdN1]